MINSLRIGYNDYFEDARFQRYIEMFKNNAGVIDEVALFTHYSHHGYLTLEELAVTAEKIKLRLVEFKRLGIKSAGINLLCTTGHIDEAWDVLPVPPFRTVIGREGRVSKSCLCPSDEDTKAYIKKMYQLYAGCDPDFIWIDDDFRIDNHAVADPCYCPGCIRKFNEKHNRSETFDGLVKTMNEDPLHLTKLAKDWDSFRHDLYTDLAGMIKESIYSVNRNISIGFMMTAGSARKDWIEAFDAMKLRPGGGYYTDENPTNIIVKALNCATQTEPFRKKIHDIQYELECFPNEGIAKSRTIKALEIYLALMSNCTGVAYNASLSGDDLAEAESVRILKSIYGHCNIISGLCEGKESVGVYCYEHIIKHELGKKLCEIGIPVTVNKQAASVYVLTENTVDDCTDDELNTIFSKGVFMDAKSCEKLEKRGLAHLCGCILHDTYSNGMAEIFTDDPLNGKHEGYSRNAYMNFYTDQNFSPVYTLSPQSENCRIISELATIRGEKKGPCLCAFENRLGGRVAVSSYFYADHFQFYEKRDQLRNIFDWLSRDTMCVRINPYRKIAPFVKQSPAEQKFLIQLVNLSIDDTGSFTVDVRADAASGFYVIKQDESREPLESEVIPKGVRLTISNISSFHTLIISNE